jgi:hypothetical protein
VIRSGAVVMVVVASCRVRTLQKGEEEEEGGCRLAGGLAAAPPPGLYGLYWVPAVCVHQHQGMHGIIGIQF